MKAPRAQIRLSAAVELENIEVVNRHSYSGPQDNSYVYVGRGTPLGNQWSHHPGTAATHNVDTREQSVSKFNDWLGAEIDKGQGPAFEALQRIKATVARGEQVKLSCSCVPELCHGEVIKASVELLIHNDRNPEQQLQREPLQILASQPTLDKTAANNERSQAPVLSGRAEQAHSEIDTHTAIDDLAALYTVPEGVSRAEHASYLNSIDQFTRENFERGATLAEDILSIPKDPDGHEQEDKVRIGTEAHAINFVREFVADPAVAEEKGRQLYELGNKACGQWTESNGRLAIFKHIYKEIRIDQSGNRRTGEEKAQVIDQVLEETALWAQPLPEPTPEPNAEEVHQFTVALAEQNRDLLHAQLSHTETIGLERPEPSPYFDHLQSIAYGMDGNGLATIGEIAGYSDLQYDNAPDTPDLVHDESELYAEIYQIAVSDAPDSIPDHLGDEHEPSSSVTFDATFDRVSLAQMPPQIPDSLETHDELLNHLLPAVDAQIENGLTDREILAPIYESNHAADQRDFQNQVADTFVRAGELPSDALLSRAEELNAISSLRILVATEYREQAKPFSRDAILWSKENYRVNPDRLRMQGKLQVGEYQRIVTNQSEARNTWLANHPGQQAPTRAETASLNRLEQSGQQLNAAIAGINPTAQEHAAALNHIQSRLSSTTQSAESLLGRYEAAERGRDLLSRTATRYAESVRLSPEFQDRHTAIVAEMKENSIDQRQELIRGNNPRFDSPSLEPALDLHATNQRSNYPELTGDREPLTPYAELSLANNAAERDALQQLADTLISPEITNAQLQNNAELTHYSELCQNLTGVKAVSASQAREAISLKLQGLEKASSMVEATRTRFNLQGQPKELLTLAPPPAYISLSANTNIRMPVESLREHGLLQTVAEQCRLDTSTWSSLNAPRAISGSEQERTDTVRFVSQYIDYRIKDHATKELSFKTTNPTFRAYSEKLAAAHTPAELLKVGNEIRLENYNGHNQIIAHRADPLNVPAPDRQPLQVKQMREVFLSTTPTASNRADRAEMREILHSMTIFGKDKTERVKLLAEGKLAPSADLAKLIANLETRQTVRAVDHFYRSLKTPAETLGTKNRFDIKTTYDGLQQYEKDYFYTQALAQRYEFVNNKLQGNTLSPEQTNQGATSNLELVADQAATAAPAITDIYRDYYGRADWLEAQNVVTAAANVAPGASQNLEHNTIIPELKDVEVEAINYVVNTFDQNRQAQISDHLKSSPDPHQQAIGDIIKIASEVKVAGATPGPKEIELQIPANYTLSPDSVTTVVNYTQEQAARATEATKLPASELSALRQDAQAQAWRDMASNVIKDPATILDAPAEVIYQAQDLTNGITQTAALQERARTAYQILNNHTSTCTTKVEKAVAQEQTKTEQPFRSPEQQQTTRELVNVALNPELQQSKAELIKANASEYALVQQTLTSDDKERAAQFKEYAATTRTEYLQSFTKLDSDKQSLQAQEARSVSETRNAGAAESTLDRYTAAKDEIVREALGEKVQQMVQDKSLPEIPHEQLASLTVKDLIPAEVRETAVELAREPAWQSLEPVELHANGREVPEQIVNIADEVMDRVAVAQTVELEIDAKETELTNFIADQVALVERPVQEERAAIAYDERFRENLTAIASQKEETPDRAEAATQILETLDRAELDPATLVSQATTQQLDLVPADVVIEAHTGATAHAEEVRAQPVFSPDQRQNIQQETLAQLSGPAADRYTELQTAVNETQERFQTSVESVDEKITELEVARAELGKESALQQFQDVSRPAAVEINAYFKDTVREEGLPALLDPERFDQHVAEIAQVIIETAQTHGITLGDTTQGQQEVNKVAADLFKTLTPGLERANAQLTINQQLATQLETTAHLTEHSYAQLATDYGTAGDHSTNQAFSQQERERERDENSRGQNNSTTKIQEQATKEQSPQEVAQAQEISTPAGGPAGELGGSTAEIGASLEDAAALLLL